MDFKRPRNLFIDNDKMVNLQHGTPESPISFIYDEIEKYDQGYIDWHWHPEMEFNVATDNPIEVFVGDRSVVLKKKRRYMDKLGPASHDKVRRGCKFLAC